MNRPLFELGDGVADMLQRRANAPLRPRKAQLPADHGLFSDEAAQIDLIEMLQEPVED